MDSNDKMASLQHLRKTFASALKESNGVVSDANLDNLLAIFNRVSFFLLRVFINLSDIYVHFIGNLLSLK